MMDDTLTAGWIVRQGDRDRAAGPGLHEAVATARMIGFRDGVARPATASEIDALDLPPTALSIERDGGPPWWRAPEDRLHDRCGGPRGATGRGRHWRGFDRCPACGRL